MQPGAQGAGIERSAPMIARLRTKLDDAALPVTRGDMTPTTVPGTFSVGYLVVNTICNLLTQDEQVECFRNAAHHLAPGSRFVVEFGVPPLRVLPPGQRVTVFAVADGNLGVDTIDPLTQQLVSHHVRFGAGREARLQRGPHRHVWPSELALMGRLAGFELGSRHADWAGARFPAESESHVSVYRLPVGVA